MMDKQDTFPIEGKTLSTPEVPRLQQGAFILSLRDPKLEDRVGSIVADRE